jgi:PAS domain S-box-containing protein
MTLISPLPLQPLCTRLLGLGLPQRALLRMQAGFGPEARPEVLDLSGWDLARLKALPLRPGDAVVVAGSGGRGTDELDLGGLRALFASLPMLAWVAPADPGISEALLRAGLQETFGRFQELPAALGRARARMAASPGLGLAVEAEETAPAEGDQSYEGLFPNLYDWIYVVGVSEAGGFTFETVNPPLGAGSGFLNPDFTGRAPEQCLRPASAELFRAHFQRVLAEGRPLLYEEEHVVESRPRNFQTILTPVRNKWGRIHRIAAISRDITALREAQAALQASEERLNLALEGTQQSLWDWDLASGEMYRNPRWFGMLGLEPGALAANLDAGLRLIHPEDRRQVEGALNAHLEGRQARFQAEYRVRAGSGDWTWVFDAGKVVAWDADGNPARMTGMCTDITDRRRAEESLRALVGGVVHEIRNPVYGIFINLDALEATFGEQPRFGPFVAALRESAERISSLMNDLKDYGEPRTLNPEPCLIRALLEEAGRSCAALAAERGCRVRFELEDPQLVLPLNGRRMHQVFRNLLENALHHSPAGGLVLVRGHREEGEGYEWWTFTVEDEGSGFKDDALGRAFEPFFTRRKGGTGLGLSIVKRVVEEHGGSVELGNRNQGGALLTVKLPAPRRRVELIEDERDA